MLHKTGIFEDDLITNLLNAKSKLNNKGVKTYKNQLIKSYCKKKIEILGIKEG